MGRPLENLFAFLLRNAAQHRELLALRLELLVILKAMKDFLFGLVADRTGVVEHQVGFFDGLHLPVALPYESADDLLRVVHVHLASEGLKVERSLPRICHFCQYSAAKPPLLCLSFLRLTANTAHWLEVQTKCSRTRKQSGTKSTNKLSTDRVSRTRFCWMLIANSSPAGRREWLWMLPAVEAVTLYGWRGEAGG